jgi:hypothetical protein
MALAQELKEAKSWSQVYHFPKTKAWKKILALENEAHGEGGARFRADD